MVARDVGDGWRGGVKVGNLPSSSWLFAGPAQRRALRLFQNTQTSRQQRRGD